MENSLLKLNIVNKLGRDAIKAPSNIVGVQWKDSTVLSNAFTFVGKDLQQKLS